LDRDAFIFALTCSPHFSFDGPLGMVYEFLQDCFVLNDYANGFDIFFEICGHIAHNHVPQSISHLLHHDYSLWKNKLEAFDPS
jgi:hypothetical protein